MMNPEVSEKLKIVFCPDCGKEMTPHQYLKLSQKFDIKTGKKIDAGELIVWECKDKNAGGIRKFFQYDFRCYVKVFENTQTGKTSISYPGGGE